MTNPNHEDDSNRVEQDFVVDAEKMVDAEGLSKDYVHCVRVYARMYNESYVENGMRLWEGYTTKIFHELGLSNPHYTSVLNTLVRAGCIRQLQRGGGNANSVFEVIRNITPDLFREHYTKAGSKRARNLEQKVNDLSFSMNRHSLQMEQLDERLRALEKKYENG